MKATISAKLNGKKVIAREVKGSKNDYTVNIAGVVSTHTSFGATVKHIETATGVNYPF